jgi:hypothetical protein
VFNLARERTAILTTNKIKGETGIEETNGKNRYLELQSEGTKQGTR